MERYSKEEEEDRREKGGRLTEGWTGCRRSLPAVLMPRPSSLSKFTIMYEKSFHKLKIKGLKPPSALITKTSYFWKPWKIPEYSRYTGNISVHLEPQAPVVVVVVVEQQTQLLW